MPAFAAALIEVPFVGHRGMGPRSALKRLNRGGGPSEGDAELYEAKDFVTTL
jgi:hypothetical protein